MVGMLHQLSAGTVSSLFWISDIPTTAAHYISVYDCGSSKDGK